jgi:type III pantothenate kinase
MKILCIDVGNTSIHYGLVEKGSVENTGNFPTRRFYDGPSEAFAHEVALLADQSEGFSFCSFFPRVNDPLVASFETFARPTFHLTHTNCAGLNLVYPKPEEIGEDRLANALAAQAFHGRPAIVIDMGTAVTFDIISSAGYEGGIIAPGLALMTNYLHEQTALLPKLKPEDLLEVEGAIGKSTVHAIKLGVSIGFSGMIEALLRRVVDELMSRGESNPVVLSTGGSIANLTKDWGQKSRFVENLTLMGLAVGFERVKKG